MLAAFLPKNLANGTSSVSLVVFAPVRSRLRQSRCVRVGIQPKEMAGIPPAEDARGERSSGRCASDGLLSTFRVVSRLAVPGH